MGNQSNEKSFSSLKKISRKNFKAGILRYAITVFSCVMIIVMGAGILAYASATTIGENIITNILTATGLTVNGTATTTNLIVDSGTVSLPNDSITDAMVVDDITITNALYSTGSYSNPAWLTTLGADKLTSGTISNERISGLPYAKLSITDGNLSIAKTSGLQTALDGKLPLTGGTVAGNLTVSGNTVLATTTIGNLIVSGNVTGANLNIVNWDTAYGWGDHSIAGYLTDGLSITLGSLSDVSTTTLVNGSVLNYQDGWTSTSSLFIKSDGKVGIGTVDPSEALEINGNLYMFDGDIKTDRYLKDNSNTFLGVGVAGAGNLYNHPEFPETGKNNTYFGNKAGYNTNYGNGSSAFGSSAMYYNTQGGSNFAMGKMALYHNVIGSQNVALGTHSLFGVSGVSILDNVAIGESSGYYMEGDRNILIGYQAGYASITGNNNILIGYNIDIQSASDSNTLSIGNLIFGTGIDGAGTSISSGNIGIGTTNPASTLQVDGGITFKKVISDPCGVGYPEGVQFYNDTADCFCFCDGMGVDKKVSDNSACF